MTEAERHALSAHFQQLQELTAAGVCVVAGPTLDADYGICIMDGLDQVEVLARLEHDAMVSAGFFRAELRAYKLSLERSH
jgi:uncharacterized protein YciI